MLASYTSSSVSQNSHKDVGTMILKDLKSIVIKVKKLRRWHLVSRLTRAFTESLFLTGLKTVKSFTLMKAIVNTFKELRELISEEAKLIRIGLKEAWKISELASSWGHNSSRNWREDKNFVIWQALTLKWVSRLFGGLLGGIPRSR